MKILYPMLIAALLAGAPVRASADAAQRGDEIAREMEARDKDFGDYRMSMEMLLRDKGGASSTRQMQGAVLEIPNDGDKSVITFESPADIRGASFLTFAHVSRPDDQWLYMPSIKRTKRIASESRMGSFMGSEFAFEDMASQEYGKYGYTYLGEDKVDERRAYKIERKPKYAGSGYARNIVWVDSERYVPLRIEFYDRKDALLKTLSYSGYQQYKNTDWRADRMEMRNQQNGKSTEIRFSKYAFQTSVSDADFDPQRLGSLR
ncbi:MAG: outer membrane lipoprotein-sorting protein [Gammaproteobacteria bacterium]